jgi:hypothetical protein
MGLLGEEAGAELVSDLDDPEQPVLELLPLPRAGSTAEDLEPAVDLDRVAGDRHRVLAAIPQQLTECDDDARLADRGRPEDGDQLHLGALGEPGAQDLGAGERR